jgi:hypothetical protein
MVDMRSAYKTLVKSLGGKGQLENLGLYGKIILKWILKIKDFIVWTGLRRIRIGMSERLV